MGDLTDSLTPSTTTTTTTTAIAPYSRPLPVREDCWSEEATSTLVDAWGRRYMELNRGNLRQKDWQDVADAVNALHAHSKKTHRTDVQCKNRIDTIKKKYKQEKTRVTSSNGTLTSSWPFFERMDALIGSNVKASSNFSPKLSQSPPVAVPLSYRKTHAINNNNNMNHNISSPNLTPIPAATVVALPQKRGYNSEGYYRNYSAVAAAAAAAESEEEEAEEEAEEEENENEENFGVKRLAKAIERFGEVYERVEAEKLRQMVELEKQRMQFASDLEMQRLRMFTEMQVQLERNKRSKRSSPNDMYS
ncbi:trihelix transcription factor ASIL2-like [Pistacia vera]|uniref:trihelix transcription factor ASIL2-like n=1 Tax=Pistacia vera TaxID=55513 RepID=UPI001263C832|nr:trihelix transcription factor ASIL2-like [Pistacia vera]